MIFRPFTSSTTRAHAEAGSVDGAGALGAAARAGGGAAAAGGADGLAATGRGRSGSERGRSGACRGAGSRGVRRLSCCGAVAGAVSAGRAERGLLVCGTGIGMSIRANREPAVRAAKCNDPFEARMARAHNDANVLCLGARVIDASVAEELLDTFLATPFEGGRHAARVGKLTTEPC